MDLTISDEIADDLMLYFWGHCGQRRVGGDFADAIYIYVSMECSLQLLKQLDAGAFVGPFDLSPTLRGATYVNIGSLEVW